MAETIRRRDLPHWDVPGAAYFVTVCLEGSTPAEGFLAMERRRQAFDTIRAQPAEKAPDRQRRRWKTTFVAAEEWLDHKPAARHLADPNLAGIVVDALFHFAGQRYDLLAFVVMPSHFHWVFRPLDGWMATLGSRVRARSPREAIVHSINRFTARQCNKLRSTKGAFWQHECYDHWVRDSSELERIIAYIELNPVKAGLVQRPEEWRFSSANARVGTGAEIGLPLVRVSPT